MNWAASSFQKRSGGRHEELLQQNGRYRALYETQFAGQES